MKLRAHPPMLACMLAALPASGAVGQDSLQYRTTALCPAAGSSEILYTNHEHGFQFRFPPGYVIAPAKVHESSRKATRESVTILVTIQDMTAPEQIAQLQTTLRARGIVQSDSALRATMLRKYDASAPTSSYEAVSAGAMRRLPELRILRQGPQTLDGRTAHFVDAFFADTTLRTRRTLRHLHYVLFDRGRFISIMATGSMYDFHDEDATIRRSLSSFRLGSRDRCAV